MYGAKVPVMDLPDQKRGGNMLPPDQAGPCKTTESIVQVTVVPETEALAPVMVYFVAPL